MLRLLAIAGLMALGISAEPDSASIVDSGSTNRPGFVIAVDRSGTAELTPRPRQSKPIRRMLPRASARRFYADLRAAKPLASLPAVHCMKSASFRSTRTVAFGGERTPDLSCGDGGNAAMRNLIRDVNEIVALFPIN